MKYMSKFLFFSFLDKQTKT